MPHSVLMVTLERLLTPSGHPLESLREVPHLDHRMPNERGGLSAFGFVT
jgi:hypothetical protein